jgi:cell wall-associated NlpC family hydrolase
MVYRRSGDTGVTEFDTNIKASASRRKYADATSQKDNQLLNKLARAKEDLAEREAAAEKVRADVQQKQDDLKGQQADFETQQAALTKLKNQVNGQIADLVAQEQAKRAAEEAARTKALVAANPVSGSAVPTFDTSKIPPASGAAGAVVAYASAQLGKPYCYAGTGPDCFDCSGLTMMAWAQAGVSMSHGSYDQLASFPRVSMDQLQPGDLVYWDSHVGIYVGNGSVLHAPHTGTVVQITPIWPGVIGANRPS